MHRRWMVVIVAVGIIGGGVIGGCEDVTGPRKARRVMALDSGNWWEYEWVVGSLDTLKFTKWVRIEVVGRRRVDGRAAAMVVWRWQSEGGEFRDTVFWEERNGQLWEKRKRWGRVFMGEGLGWGAKVRWLPLADFGKPGWEYREQLRDLDTVEMVFVDGRGDTTAVAKMVPEGAEYGVRYEGREEIGFADTTAVALRYRCGMRVKYTTYGLGSREYRGCEGQWLWIWVVRGIGIVQIQVADDWSWEFMTDYEPCEPRDPVMWRLRRYSIR